MGELGGSELCRFLKRKGLLAGNWSSLHYHLVVVVVIVIIIITITILLMLLPLIILITEIPSTSITATHRRRVSPTQITSSPPVCRSIYPNPSSAK